jgi:hypothetical protein
MGRTIKDPEERRKELIDTAERLFIAEGYDPDCNPRYSKRGQGISRRFLLLL